MTVVKSDLINFDFDKDKCFICGKKSQTREHTVPKWLQTKFNLWDEKIEIPNLTHTTYKKLVVPCCKKCNNEVYSKLEIKISTKNCTEKDIWMWANKIHAALRYKDYFYEFDRKNPGLKIINMFGSNDYLQKSRNFLHCLTGNYTTYPDPFGSVFVFELEEESKFNLIHIIQTSSIYICTGDRIYIIFIRDGQTLKDDLNIMESYNTIKEDSSNLIAGTLFFYAQCINYYERYTYSIPLMQTPNSIVKLGRATLRNEKPEDKESLRNICKRFGVTWIDKDEVPKNYS
ncbi:hypothetical protein [Nonlabens sp. Asnod2-A12]|uniref:hypothetical protein n=1 Tax=Nonlabens sp. Asnod2-A12 TaxID=3160578 RepID=UPI00386D38C1